MKIATCVFAVLCLIGVSIVSTQLITQTPCAYFGTVPMANFNKNLYDGQWFTYQQYDWPGSENFNCYLQIRTPNADGNHNSTIILMNTGLPTFRSDGVNTFDMPGYGHYIYTNAPYTKAYDILATDYVNYAIEWTCNKISSGNQCYLFILSRTPVVTAITQRKIDSTLDKYHIIRTGIRTLNISSCPPEILQDAGGPGLLERVLQIVAGLVAVVVGAVGGVLGGLGNLLG